MSLSKNTASSTLRELPKPGRKFSPQRFLYRFVGLLCALVGLLIWFHHVKQYALIGSDFEQDYQSALGLRNGLPIYEQLPQSFHPPLNAILYLPFTFLNYLPAFYLWSVISLLLFVWLSYLAMRTVFPEREKTLLAVAGSLLWYPFIATIALGQSSVVIAALISGSWLCLVAGRERVAGALAALACATKVFPGVLLVYFLLTRRLQAVTSFVLTSLVLGLLCLSVLGLDPILHYLHEIMPRNVLEWGGFMTNASAAGALIPLIGGSSLIEPLVSWEKAIRPLGFLSTLFVTGVFIAFAARHYKKQEACFAAACTTMIFGSPIGWVHYAVILLLPLAWYFRDSLTKQREKLLLIFALLLLQIPDAMRSRYVVSLYAPELVPWWVYHLQNSGFWAMLLLWVYSLYRLREAEEA